MAIEVVTLMPTACKETLGGAVTDSIRVAEDDTGHDCSDGSVHTKYVRHSGVFVDAENNTREHLYIVENLPTDLLALKQRVERNHQEHLRERYSACGSCQEKLSHAGSPASQPSCKKILPQLFASASSLSDKKHAHAAAAAAAQGSSASPDISPRQCATGSTMATHRNAKSKTKSNSISTTSTTASEDEGEEMREKITRKGARKEVASTKMVPTGEYLDWHYECVHQGIRFSSAPLLFVLRMWDFLWERCAPLIVASTAWAMYLSLYVPDFLLPMDEVRREITMLSPRVAGRKRNQEHGQKKCFFFSGGPPRPGDHCVSEALPLQVEVVLPKNKEDQDTRTSSSLKSKSKKNLPLQIREAAGQKGPVFIYLHGGSYLIMHPGMCRHISHRLSSEFRAPVVAPYYRKPHFDYFSRAVSRVPIVLKQLAQLPRAMVGCLLGRCSWPSGKALALQAPERALTIEDCVNDAVRTFLYLTETCGIDPKRVVFVGESAGGGLPALAILRLKELHNQDTTATNASPSSSSSWDACKPGGALMCSPWVSLAPLGPISRRTPGGKESPNWGFRSVTKDIIDANAITQVGRGVCSTLDTGDTSDPRASPLFADFTGVDVPLFVSLASNEWLRDDGIEFACKVRQHYSSSKKGNEKMCALEVHHGAFHAFQIWLFGLKHFAGKMVLDRGLQFLRRFDEGGVL